MMSVRLTLVQFCRAVPSLTARPLVLSRCIAASSVQLMKRPTFDRPQLPKRPPNAYAIFVKDNMGSTRMEDSGRLDIRKLADMWKNLSEGDRDMYKTKYEEEKRLHSEKVEEFMATLGGKKEQEDYLKTLAEYRAKRRAYLKHFRLKKLGLIKPRRSSGYQMYASERLREAGGEGLNVTLIKEIPSLWTAMSKEEKERYQKLAEERYATRLAEYTERLKKAQADGIVAIDEPEEPKKKEKKSVSSTKKSTTAKKKSSVKKKNKGTKKTSTSKSAKSAKSSTKSAKAESDEVDDDDKEDWLGPDDES